MDYIALKTMSKTTLTLLSRWNIFVYWDTPYWWKAGQKIESMFLKMKNSNILIKIILYKNVQSGEC